MSHARRVRALERALGKPQEVTWEDAYAAHDRIEARLYAKLEAMAAGRVPPLEDPVLIDPDAEVLRRWRRQRGLPEPDLAAVDRQLLDQLTRLAASQQTEAM